MKLNLEPSPHIHGKFSTRRIMIDVIVALLPAVAAGVVRLGARTLLVEGVSICAAMLTEWMLGRMWDGDWDGSAAVTGLLLALTLPPQIPLWQAAIGSAFAVGAAKMLCGGLGQNALNPALAGRALMMLVFPAGITQYCALGADGVSTATPLHQMQMPALPDVDLGDMFLGRISGSIGEISTLALLAGGAYLLVRQVISFHIPLAYLGSVAILSMIFFHCGNPFLWMCYNLLGGGVVLGAFFMATDYASAPVIRWGKILYGAGCGALTVFFRRFGLFPEGVTYAILLMNGCVWGIDQLTSPRRFGSREVVL